MRRNANLLLGLVLLLTAIMGSIKAQESGTQGFFIGTFLEGTLEESSDGVYLLALYEVPTLIDWVISTPEPFAGAYDTAALVGEWVADEDATLTTTAFLRLDNVTLRMTLGAPTYDAVLGELVFEATEVEAFPTIEDPKAKGDGIPDEFAAGSFSLLLDSAFEAGLLGGASILEEEGRVSRSNNSTRPGPPRRGRP